MLVGLLGLNLLGQFFFWIFLCGAVAVSATKWGRSPILYFQLSFFLSPLVGVIVLLLRGKDESEIQERKLRSGTHRICPNCKELILAEAVKCRYCGSTLAPIVRRPESMRPDGGIFEWSEFSPEEKVGTLISLPLVVLFLVLFFGGMLNGLTGERGANEGASPEERWNAPITKSDRKEGIESLCKVFQIYGLPKNAKDATEAAHKAADLFELASNQSPERNDYILTSLVGQFRGGKLTQSDCEQVGAPLPTTEGDR